MKQIITSFIFGTLFALGLGISQMSNPSKVIGFLNLMGNWDPTLLVVFLSATGTYFILYWWGVPEKIKNPIEEYLKDKEKITLKVVVGAICFGIGWGLLGICPGPALTNFATLNPAIFVFIAGMIGGMYLGKAADSI